MSYADFLARKTLKAPKRGLAHVPELASHLFPFQAHCVDFGLRVGTYGLFLDTGLGKTETQLEWCQKALESTNGRALILTPLAVAQQMRRRAERWGYEARVIRAQGDVGRGINICNYDRLDKIDPTSFSVISLDEGSILKNFSGKMARSLIEAFSSSPFRSIATATPAPNDHMEIGNYAEFLSLMKSNEMLSRFFINDTSTASQKWRLKGHAERPFWDWMASWALVAQKPSDLGKFSDDGYDLPPYRIIRHRTRDSHFENSLADLFGTISMSATNMHDIKRQTAAARAETVADLVSSEPDEAWILWVDTDYEGDAIASAVPHAIEIRGSQSIDQKEERLEAFAAGEIKYLIGKPSMIGLGLDWSHCARMAFSGRSYSYELWYQAIRRAWRFGQKRMLDVHLVIAEGEDTIGRAIDRKASEHAKMNSAMRAAMRRATSQGAATSVAYNPTHISEIPRWICGA